MQSDPQGSQSVKMLPSGATTRIGTSLTSAGLLLGGTAVVAETGSNEDMNIWRISGTYIRRKMNFHLSDDVLVGTYLMENVVHSQIHIQT